MIIKGHHVALGFVGFFGLIVGVNVLMATQAVRTFPGVEVKNSYVASQEFDARRDAQEALGWTAAARLEGDELVLTLTEQSGAPVAPETVGGIFGRATSVVADQRPDFTFDGRAWRAPVEAGPGNWNLRLEALAPNGTEFRQRIVVEGTE